jgi:hypothetical protein
MASVVLASGAKNAEDVDGSVIAPAPKRQHSFPRAVNEGRLDRLLYGLLAVALTLAYLIGTHAYWAPAHPGVDQNAYLVGAKLFARTGSTGFATENPFQYVGGMWIESADGRFFPKYPVGLSALFALALKLGGAKLGTPLLFMINPVAVALSLVATFLLTRLVAGSFAGLLGTILVAASPLTLTFTNNPNSHATALCCATWGVYLLVRWCQAGGLTRATVAGLLFGMAVTIRYTEGLLLLPLSLAIVLRQPWHDRRRLLEASAAGLAWTIPVLVLVAYNWHSFHHLTGYDPTNESSGFSLANFRLNWETMLRQLYNMGLFFILPFSAFGLVALCGWSWRFGLVLAAWVVPNLMLYAAYYWAPGGGTFMYLRFFLSVLPGLALPAAWALRRQTLTAGPRLPRIMATLGVGLVVAIGCGVSVSAATGEQESDAATNAVLATASEQIAKACPAGSTIFAPRPLLNWLQFAGDYSLYAPESFDHDAIQRYVRATPDAPSPLQPQRAMEAYQTFGDYTDRQLMAEQRRVVLDALRAGHHAFVIYPQDLRERSLDFLAGSRAFSTREVGNWYDPSPTILVDRQRWMGSAQVRSRDDQDPARTWAVVEIVSASP